LQGSHVARQFYKQGNCHIRIVDIAPKASLSDAICHEFICGDLRDPNLCEFVVRGVDTVLHFAANMGGMGAIHEDNDFVLYEDNHKMTVNILQAALSAGVKRFFFASSTCIYPETLQSNVSGDISLRESQVWAHPPPKPQGLYGFEKLNSELFIHQFVSKIDIYIARFHNVFGPGGAWNDGREKAPAAMLRKAWALKFLDERNAQFEIWGDGKQRRSFLFIDDVVDGVLKLLDSSYNLPLNIGSDNPIAILDLAEIAVKCVGLDLNHFSFSFNTSKPVGVASTNSNNEQVEAHLGWTPTISLYDGMKRTSEWIKKQIVELARESSNQVDVMQGLSCSKVIHLQLQKIIFAILLPITSRGSSKPSDCDCLLNLRCFSHSLIETTWRDTRDRSGGLHFHFIVSLAIDEDDGFLLASGQDRNKAEQILLEEGIFDIETLLCSHPRGHVCKLWRDCAKVASVSKRDYIVLMDDG
jgi:nucleoside-diphosphate-sugar epimerase